MCPLRTKVKKKYLCTKREMDESETRGFEIGVQVGKFVHHIRWMPF